MLHITLTVKTEANDPTDPLARTYYGYSEHDSVDTTWANNRGYYILGERADRQSYVAFSHGGKVVLVAEIDRIVPAKGKPGKRIIEGTPLGPGKPIWEAYVDGPTPARALGVRNPVTYVDEDERFGRQCACGCQETVFENDFVRGHDQTALHQRVAKIGTIKEFLRWFDSVEADQKPVRTRTTFSQDGHVSFTDDGRTVTVTVTAPSPAA